MGRVNAYLMDVQEFVWDYYNSNGNIDTTTGVKTTSDIIEKVKEEVVSVMAVDAAQQQISEIEGGYYW